MDRYCSFDELCRSECEGVGYQIRCRTGCTPYCVVAPHGGGIEPGTSEIADAIAGHEHGFYAFEGLKSRGNAVLHIPSISFDEPKALRLAKMNETVITIHGCQDEKPIVYIGGLDTLLIRKILDQLRLVDFEVSHQHPNPELQGVHPKNICNLSATGKGVQLEITVGLRQKMFSDLTKRGRKNSTEVFHKFVETIRQVLK